MLLACGGGGSSGDAGSDATTKGESGGASCSGHAFCDDFESGPVGSRWSAGAGAQLATWSLETDHSVSPTHAARVTIADGAQGALAILDTTIGPATNGVRCTWQLLVEQGAPASALGNGLANLKLTGPSGAPVSSDLFMMTLVQGQVWMGENLSFADGGNTAVVHKNTGGPTVGTWTTMLIDVDMKAQMVTLGVGNDVETYPGTPPSSATQMELAVQFASTSQSAWMVDFDDVVCDTR